MNRINEIVNNTFNILANKIINEIANNMVVRAMVHGDNNNKQWQSSACNFSHTRAYNDSHASDSASLQRQLIHMTLQILYTEASVVSRLTIPTCGFQRHKSRERIGYLFHKSSERAISSSPMQTTRTPCPQLPLVNPPCSKSISQQSLLGTWHQ